MNTIDAVCDWLANHELVGVAILFGVISVLIFTLVFWVFRGNLPPLDDDEYGEGGQP